MVTNIKPNKKRIAIRADASTDIGIGHIMRSMILAKEMQKRGKEIFFICRGLSSTLSRSILDQGFQLESLPDHRVAGRYIRLKGPSASPSNSPEKFPQSDLIDTVAALTRIRPYLLVVDHFGIDAKWEKEIRRLISLRIAVIDGQRNRTHDCDILIDPNYSIDGIDGWKCLVPLHCELFVGPQFAFLRPEFYVEHENIKIRNGRVNNFLVSFGGSDKYNATEMVLRAVKEINLTNLMTHVIIGSQNPWKSRIVKICRERKRIDCYIDPENVASIMAKADLAIGSGGIMTWERCFLGVPSILMSIAKNEEINCRTLSHAEAAIYVGRVARNSVDSIKNAIIDAVSNPDLLRRLSRRSLEIMSGSKTSNSNLLYESLS
jgi:UDP-2,4-diacetamido-2,4,6-trideoxy-beta-L-altropyranose hydrolase